MDDKVWREIFYSIRTGNNLQSSLLLNAELDINSWNNKGITMLSYAAEWGKLESIQFLVLKGADSNVANSDGSKPLHIAAKFGQVHAVKFFLNQGLSVDSCDKNNCTPLHYVSLRNDISVAAMYRYSELVHFLVDSKGDLNAMNQDGYTPLLFAARNGQKAIVDLFVRLGANVECCDNNQWTFLHYSSRNGWTDIIRCLIGRGCTVDLNARTSKGDTPLIIAANSRYNKVVVDLLIESGANVKCQNFEGKTMLHCACINEWLGVVQYLVKKGCDINAKTCKGHTPLLTAAMAFSLSIVEYLIESGADVKCCDDNDWTALHFACNYRWLNVVKSLIKKGSDLNAQECNGDTPLHVVVRYKKPNFRRDLAIIQHLLEEGADCNVKNGNGHTSFTGFIRKINFSQDGMHVQPGIHSEEDGSENDNISEKGIRLFLEKGAYFQFDDCVAISEKPFLKIRILQDEILCTQAVINKFNNADLPKVYEIPVVASRLPPYEKLKIDCSKEASHDIAKSVKHEIQTKGFCNVFNVRYIALSVLCIRSLSEHC